MSITVRIHLRSQIGSLDTSHLGLLRSLATTAVLVTLYCLLPLNHIKSVQLMLVPWFLLLFARAYVTMANANPANFSTHPLTRTDALYFTVTVFATVGFGDITAVSQSARLEVTTQIMLDLLVLVLGLGVRVFVGAVQFARRQAGPGGPQARHGNRATAHNDRPNPRTTLQAWARSLPTLPCRPAPGGPAEARWAPARREQATTLPQPALTAAPATVSRSQSEQQAQKVNAHNELICTPR